MVAYLTGREDEGFDAWERSHRAHLADGGCPPSRSGRVAVRTRRRPSGRACRVRPRGDVRGAVPDPELATLARVGEGRCLIYLGQLVERIARLDEAMVGVSATELSPAPVGDTYCTAIEACRAWRADRHVIRRRHCGGRRRRLRTWLSSRWRLGGRCMLRAIARRSECKRVRRDVPWVRPEACRTWPRNHRACRRLGSAVPQWGSRARFE